jgi:hypothetical protein
MSEPQYGAQLSDPASVRSVPVFDAQTFNIDPVNLDASVIPDYRWPPIEQLDIRCCTSAAVAVCMEMVDLKEPPAVQLSPLFNHYDLFASGPSPGQYSLYNALSSAKNVGICSIELHNYPFNNEYAYTPPSNEARVDADERKISWFPQDAPVGRKHFRSIGDCANVDNWRAALSLHQGVAFVIPLTPEYEQMNGGNNVHNIPGSLTPASFDDYHAVAAIGYDDAPGVRAVYVRDCQGNRFADGCWWLPYELIAVGGFIQEAWTVDAITY